MRRRHEENWLEAWRAGRYEKEFTDSPDPEAVTARRNWREHWSTGPGAERCRS